jgi:acyl carrier protein
LPERIDLWIRRDSTVDDTPAGGVHPRPGIQSAYVAPSGETEQAIAKSWQALLGIEQVGAHDNFFDLGGHSLLATKLVARLRAEFQVDLPLQKFFESPTISGLARAITRLQAESEDQQTADLLERVAHLSDEEVEMELNKGLNPR